jgi:Xaa-Pro aminopeptidase
MAPADRPDWFGRLSRVGGELAARSLDALVISNPTNLRYLGGYTGSAGLLVCTPSRATLIVDGRYSLATRHAIAAGRLGPMDVAVVEGRYDLTLGSVLASQEVGSAGFEAEHLTVALFDAWKLAAPGVTWQATYRIVESHRAVKDAVEIATLRRAATLLSDVARLLPGIVAAGRTEREVARAIEQSIDTVGFSAPAFPTIVASGPNSALPHARPTDRRLQAGDLVVLDFGGVLDGYCGDLTRMAAIEQVSAEALALFAAVREAHAAAIAAVRPGVLASDVDAAARLALSARGVGSAFLHGTGHGLGLDLHEAPRLGRPDADRVEPLIPGMVCTIEPGVYVEGTGGVRLEDDVLVTAGGCEVLTDAPRDLLVV